VDPVNVQAQVEVRSFTDCWDNSANVKTWASPWIRPSRSPKVTDFGTNRMRVYEFLLVRNSYLGRISHRFGDIAGIQPQFWGCSRCTRWPMLSVPRAKAVSYSAVKLFSKYSNWCENIPERHRQTDRHTDNIRQQYRAMRSIAR